MTPRSCVEDAHISANTCRKAMVVGSFKSSRRAESYGATQGSDRVVQEGAARAGR